VDLVERLAVGVGLLKHPSFATLACQQRDQRGAFFCWMTLVSWWMKLEGS
jgi:hypothetical protein